MKLLLINSVYAFRSTGRIVQELKDYAESKNDRVFVAYGRYLKEAEENIYRIGSKYSTIRHMTMTTLFDAHGFSSKNETKLLIKWIEEIKPDVIHIHNIHGYYLNVEELFNFFKTSKIPVVWTLHDCWSFTGHCAHFEYANCDKWKTQCHHCPEKCNYPISYGLDNSLINYKKKREIFSGLDNILLVSPSKWLSDRLKESFLNNYQTDIINTGIDLNVFFKPNKDVIRLKEFVDKFIILGVANPWSERKGLSFFHELSKNLNSNEIIIMIGLNKKQINLLPKNIIGYEVIQSPKKLAYFYQISDVFINPTLEDTYPTTNLESLACGTPVITFNSGGSSESIDDRTGIVLKKKNIESLIEAKNQVKKLGKDYFSSNCIEKSKNFNKKLFQEKYYSVYLKMINASSKHFG